MLAFADLSVALRAATTSVTSVELEGAFRSRLGRRVDSTLLAIETNEV